MLEQWWKLFQPSGLIAFLQGWLIKALKTSFRIKFVLLHLAHNSPPQWGSSLQPLLSSLSTPAERDTIPQMTQTVAPLHALAWTVVPSKCPFLCLLIYRMPFQLHTPSSALLLTSYPRRSHHIGYAYLSLEVTMRHSKKIMCFPLYNNIHLILSVTGVHPVVLSDASRGPRWKHQTRETEADAWVKKQQLFIYKVMCSHKAIRLNTVLKLHIFNNDFFSMQHNPKVYS